MWSHVIVSCMLLTNEYTNRKYVVLLCFTLHFNSNQAVTVGAVTRMEELQRLQASRRGHRGHLTKLFRKSEDILAKQNSITELDLASANTTLDNLKKKGEKLRELDREIAPKIMKLEDLEQEIIGEEEIQEEIAKICAKLSVIVKNGVISVPTVVTTVSSPAQITPSTISTNSNTSAATQNTSPVNSTVDLITNTPIVMPSLTQPNTSLSTSSVTFKPPQSQAPIATNTTNSYSSRLPKLSLPVFSGVVFNFICKSFGRWSPWAYPPRSTPPRKEISDKLPGYFYHPK